MLMQATRKAVQALAALHVGKFAIGAADGDVKGELFTKYLRWMLDSSSVFRVNTEQICLCV